MENGRPSIAKGQAALNVIKKGYIYIHLLRMCRCYSVTATYTVAQSLQDKLQSAIITSNPGGLCHVTSLTWHSGSRVYFSL